MGRLTEKVNGEYIHKVHKFSLNDCYNKLGKLEDIEEELGIPLEVLFKALKDGIWCKVLEDIEKFEACEIIFHYDVKKLLVWICCDYLSFELKDYGETWWLEKPNE